MISDNTKVLLLLMLKSISPDNTESLKPSEARKVLDLLDQNNEEISSLLENKKLLSLIESENGISESRLSKLLSNSMSLSINLTNWSKMGIWVISVLDLDCYPIKLKMKYRDKCPLIIYGSGNKKNLNKSGFGIVGSRKITAEESQYAHLSGKKFASKDILVVTGGARGIDQDSMFGSLQNDGHVLCILPSELSSKVVDKKYRNYIEKQKLTMISCEEPESNWTPGRAMARNKYIYLLSNGVLVVASDKKGGTWTGANECIKHNWVPIYVKSSSHSESGVNDLKKIGALNDKDLNLKKINNEIRYELLTVKEISVIENKSIKAVKTFLTKNGISSIDRLLKTKKTKTKVNDTIDNQKELF